MLDFTNLQFCLDGTVYTLNMEPQIFMFDVFFSLLVLCYLQNFLGFFYLFRLKLNLLASVMQIKVFTDPETLRLLGTYKILWKILILPIFKVLICIEWFIRNKLLGSGQNLKSIVLNIPNHQPAQQVVCEFLCSNFT